MDHWEWQYEGACREVEPSVFFHPEGERGSALAIREPYGVWGGMSEDERAALSERGMRRAG